MLYGKCKIARLLLVVSSVLLCTAFFTCAAFAAPSLMEMYSIIKTKEFVDLTHAFDSNIPHWPGFPKEKRETIYWYDKGVGTLGEGFFAQMFSHVGQWGTHADPPAHFIKGGRTLDEICVRDMLLPLVVIDISKKVAANHDYVLTLEDVKEWESRNGPVPEGAFVALRTDWSKRWPSHAAMQNVDENGVAHYPGWGMEALKYLYEERKITSSGHETTDADPGLSTTKGDYSCQIYLHSIDKHQIELLTNLDKVPEIGALIVATFPKPVFGSGFPARAFAILP